MSIKKIAERIPIFAGYYMRSNTLFQIHSPFLYDFIKTVFDSERLFYDFIKLDQFWRQIMADSTEIPESEFAVRHHQSKKRIKEFATKAISKPNHYELLYRLSHYLKPSHSLELGSCLGLSSLAMALGNRNQKVDTVEGNSFLAAYCKKSFEKYQIKNIDIYNLSFIEFLNAIHHNPYDLIFLDGDHTYSSTLEYSKKLLQSSPAHSVLVLDDIHWSKDMYRAWKEIIRLPEVHCSLETQRLGFLFKSTEITEGHFSYIPFWYKPWKIGITG